MTTTTWIQQAKQKVASTAPQDDKAITEAFAQQAYTAIGNRDREIMRDPYMLGFEIVTKNEENTRLVGVFAFRVSGEILLAPVFYLNGQIKGQDLLYRKGVNRFYPNTDKWVAYLKSRGEDSEGRGVARQGWTDARIHMNLNQVGGSMMPKNASADREAFDAMVKQACVYVDSPEGRPVGKGPISQLWKEAQDAWTVAEPEYLFADIVIEQGMQKEAAALASRLHEFAEMIEIGGLLKHASIQKTAAAQEPELILYREPRAGAPEEEVSEFYKRGFALADTRDMKGLSEAYDESAFRADWATLREPGVQKAKDMDGTETSVLWGPVYDLYGGAEGAKCCGPSYSSSNSHSPLGADYAMVVLEGPDKGTFVRYSSGTSAANLPVFAGDSADITDGKTTLGATAELKGEKPKAGNAYAIWMPSLQKFYSTKFCVRSISTRDGITRINFTDGAHNSLPGDDGRLIMRADIEECDEADLRDDAGPAVLGADAVFVLLKAAFEYGEGKPQTPANITWTRVDPPAFKPLTADRLNTALLGTRSSRVEVIRSKQANVYDIRRDGITTCREVGALELVWKLAHCLALPAAEVYDIYDNLKPGARAEFIVVKAREKSAHAFYDRQIDPESEFGVYDYDGDLGVPVDFNRHEAQARAMRYQQVTPQRRYLDAKGYGGPRNENRGGTAIDHIPDEDILRMANPGQQLSQMGQRLGINSLIDHGAVASLTNVFDAVPFITEYVSKLEGSLDYLARLLFMLYWKPKDFAGVFGSDDLPQMENKLIGVFTSYGDLILELRQSAGDKITD